MPRFMPLPLGRSLIATVLTALALLLVPSAANPAGQIVVYGASSGSTLTLSTDGSRILVKGTMARRAPEGCKMKVHHRLAVCPLKGASSVQVVMGPSGDFVQVADPLPLSLTVYLGAGSDKFIGNAEQDTCYPEGARRNRCVGGPGDDVCITGEDNSDCVGGPGQDYCRHGNGSDGCWGGPGDDICVMGAGQDGCHGEEGNDRLYGGPNPDQLYGGPGFDYCDGGPGWGKSHECDEGPRR